MQKLPKITPACQPLRKPHDFIQCILSRRVPRQQIEGLSLRSSRPCLLQMTVTRRKACTCRSAPCKCLLEWIPPCRASSAQQWFHALARRLTQTDCHWEPGPGGPRPAVDSNSTAAGASAARGHSRVRSDRIAAVASCHAGTNDVSVAMAPRRGKYRSFPPICCRAPGRINHAADAFIWIAWLTTPLVSATGVTMASQPPPARSARTLAAWACTHALDAFAKRAP